MSLDKLMSHNEANYQITLSSLRRCGKCAMFVNKRPPACTLVHQPISARDVCDYFEKMKESDRAA